MLQLWLVSSDASLTHPACFFVAAVDEDASVGSRLSLILSGDATSNTRDLPFQVYKQAIGRLTMFANSIICVWQAGFFTEGQHVTYVCHQSYQLIVNAAKTSSITLSRGD